MSIFKYLPPVRLDFFETLQLRYSQPAVFNDPFEAKPFFSGIAPPDTLQATYAGRYLHILFDTYMARPQEFRVSLNFQSFGEALEPVRLQVYEIFRQVEDSYVPQLNDLMHRRFSEDMGALSLTRVSDSLLMWSHYADSHRGFVLEFDERHPYFSNRGGPEEIWGLKKIEYKDARPHTTAIELDIGAILLTKHSSWSYEQELKHFRPLNQACNVRPASPLPMHLFCIPADSVRKVIFGAKVPPTILQDTVRLVRRSRIWSHVALLVCRLDEQQYGLTLHDVHGKL